MVRIILFCVLVYLFIKLINRLFFAGGSPARPAQDLFTSGQNSVREMVQDPVCKVYVPKKDALTLSRNGTTYYFCCAECLRKFENTPGR